jgi:hypothetical protein
MVIITSVFTHLEFWTQYRTGSSALSRFPFSVLVLLQLFGRIDRWTGTKDIINGCSTNWSMTVDLESA